jgi:hypothetical protein
MVTPGKAQALADWHERMGYFSRRTQAIPMHVPAIIPSETHHPMSPVLDPTTAPATRPVARPIPMARVCLPNALITPVVIDSF